MLLNLQCLLILLMFFMGLSNADGLKSRAEKIREACEAMEMIEYTLIKSDCDLEIDMEKVNIGRRIICDKTSKCEETAIVYVEAKNILHYLDENIKQNQEDSSISFVTDFMFSNFYSNIVPLLLSLLMIIVRNFRYNCLRILIILISLVCLSSVLVFLMTEFDCKEDHELILKLFSNVVKPVMTQRLLLPTNTTYYQQNSNPIQSKYPGNWLLTKLYFLLNIFVATFYIKVEQK